MNSTGLRVLINGLLGCSRWQESRKRKKRLKQQMKRNSRKITITID